VDDARGGQVRPEADIRAGAGTRAEAGTRSPWGDDGGHPGWCQFDVPGEVGGTEHVSRLHQWSPRYQHEAALTGWVRQVSYPDGSAETPAAVLRIDNPDQPGELAMSAEDLAACAERLLRLRDALLADPRPAPQ